MKTLPTSAVVAGAAMLLVGLGGGWMLSEWRAGGAHGAGAPAAASTPAGERRVLYWYDPMVPTQRFDRPGKSPFMDMQLVPRYADEAGEAASAVAVSPRAAQSLGLRLATAEKRVLVPTVDVVGTVGLNERDVSVVQARANGFVERVYGRAPGDVIAAGAPLADVLHPEWLAAQREYLAVRATGDTALTRAARARLALVGVPESLVERIEATGQVQAVTTIVAPTGGLIAELMVREGMTVGMGMTLARINGLATVWVEAALPEALAASVAPGQRAEMRLAAFPGEVMRGKVTAVLPQADRETRTLRVRVELPNPGGRLRAGLSGQVSLAGGKGAAGAELVTVPSEAVIRTGRRALVYVAEAPGSYRPVEVELGAEADGRVAVLKGLSAGQQVVASGQFLVDSEASLQGLESRGSLTPASAGPAGASGSASSAPAAASPAAGAAAGEFAANGRVVEVDARSITLEHEPVPALKWPAMTMPFQLAGPQLARGLKAGDAVRFRFRQRGDEHVVTTIERAASAAGAASAGGRP